MSTISRLAGLWCVNVGYSCTTIIDAVNQQMRELPYYCSFFNSTTEPAIELAEQGFAASPRLQMLMERERFQVPLKNPEYAAALRAIAREGTDVFYRGTLTADMVRAVRTNARRVLIFPEPASFSAWLRSASSAASNAGG